MPTLWTVAQIPSVIPDQTGRRAIVTGANSGIGYPTALELARRGATVVVASRSVEKGTAAAERINQEIGAARVEFSELDLASLASVRAFAERELARGARLDLLINNAGVYQPPKRQETTDGFEVQFGTNVLGHFALTGLLLPALERAAGAAGSTRPPRVVTVASIAHKPASLQFADLQFAEAYSPARSYGQSKLANLMLAFEMDRRLRARGLGILSVAAHPGVSETNLFQAGTYSAFEKTARRLVGRLIGAVLNDDVDGALPTIFAATAPEAVSGGYYGPQGLGETRGGDVGPARVAPQAQDEASAKRLWAVCEDLTGVRFLDS